MIYPYVTENGEIREIELPEPCGEYLKLVDDKLSKRLGKVCQVIFHRETFFVSLDKKRHVFCRIYLDTRFFSEVKTEFRMQKINEWVNERAAWFFSYGTRQVDR